MSEENLGRVWRKRREPMSKCFEAREADDILNICCKKQAVFSLVCKNHHYWIPCSYRHCTSIAPRNQEPRRACSAHGCRAWRRTANRESSRGAAHLHPAANLERKVLTTHFLMCWSVWNSVTSPIRFSVSLFLIFLFFMGSFEVWNSQSWNNIKRKILLCKGIWSLNWVWT